MKYKRINEALIILIVILLSVFSYKLDAQVNLFFKDVKFPIFDFALSTITNFGVVVLVMLAIPTIIIHKKNKKASCLLWLAFAISLVLAFLIKLIVLRQRPENAFTYSFIRVLNYSFPSMHSMAVFSLLPLLATYLPRQKTFWTAFAFLAAFSRIYFGLHFLSDVVFGALLGYFIGYSLLKLYEKRKLALWK